MILKPYSDPQLSFLACEVTALPMASSLNASPKSWTQSLSRLSSAFSSALSMGMMPLWVKAWTCCKIKSVLRVCRPTRAPLFLLVPRIAPALAVGHLQSLRTQHSLPPKISHWIIGTCLFFNPFIRNFTDIVLWCSQLGAMIYFLGRWSLGISRCPVQSGMRHCTMKKNLATSQAADIWWHLTLAHAEKVSLK